MLNQSNIIVIYLDVQIVPEKTLSNWLCPFDMSPSFFTHGFNVLAQSGVHSSSCIFFTPALGSSISQAGPSSWVGCSWVGNCWCHLGTSRRQANPASKLRMMDLRVKQSLGTWLYHPGSERTPGLLVTWDNTFHYSLCRVRHFLLVEHIASSHSLSLVGSCWF